MNANEYQGDAQSMDKGRGRSEELLLGVTADS